MSTNKIPRIELTRERSSTMESIQSLTRAIRESLRLHNIRREKKRRQKKSSGQKGDTNLLDVKDTKRARSKSMDHNIDNDEDSCNEISEVAVSAVVVSDFGPTVDCNIVTNVHQEDPKEFEDEVFESNSESNLSKSNDGDEHSQRRHSKSVDEMELAHLRQEVVVEEKDKQNKQQTQPQMSLDLGESKVTSKQQPARQSSMPTSSINRVDASVLRKRFARMLDTLRSHKFSLPSNDELQH